MDGVNRQESPMDVVHDDSAGREDDNGDMTTRQENGDDQMDTAEAVHADSTNQSSRVANMVEATSPAAADTGLETARPGSVADNSSDSEKIDEDDDSRAEGTIDYFVPDVRKLSEAGSHSGPVLVRGLPWRIMAMRRKARQSVNHLHEDSYTLGFFLQCNMDSESPSWTCHAHAKMRLVPWREGATPTERQVSHMFYNKENDWGFTNFMGYDELMDQAKGHIDPSTHAMHLQVVLHADPPHGVCWDSKKYTGFIGLKNQGATCYMNSLLQALFFTNKLRSAVYLIPTEADDPVRSVPLAIQRVFYELQSSDKPVGTKKLTKSFGWETLDSFMQHDAQELCRVLLDNMDTKMKGTRVEGTIPSLFEGKTISFIRCKDVDFESSREESFMDIQLNVKDMKDVYESFDDYVKLEVLEGDNKYDAGEHGLRDAEKGIAFIKFPPVLHLQLKRFQFDPVSENNIKINDRFEFPETLDLTKYLNGPADVAPVYFLSAVLVHSGDNHGGHYVVYINPKGDGKWCKFDDDVVVRVSKKEAIERNYGGSTDDFHQFRNCTNAYMLVYINDAMKDEILSTVNDHGIPGYLSHRLAEEREIEARKRKEKAEQGQYLNLRIITEDDMAIHQGHDLVDLDKILQKKPYRVRKDFSLTKFREVLADWFGYKPEEINFWPWHSRQGGGIRPREINLSGIDLNGHLLHELNSGFHVAGVEEDELIIFLEILPLRNPRSGLNEAKYASARRNSTIDEPHVYFFRLYDPVRRTLEYKGWDFFSGSKVSPKELMEACNQKAGFPLNTALFIYNDIKPTGVDKLITADQMPNRFSPHLDLTDGDLIVFQKQLSPEEDARLPLPGVRDYFKDLTFRTDVEFVDKERQNDDSCTFSLTLNLKMAYNQVIRAVAAKLRTDPKRIQLFRNQSSSVRDCPGPAIGTDSTLTLRDIFTSSRANVTKPKKLFYTHLDMDIDEMEARKEIKVLWQPNFREEGRDLNILVNKRGTVKDLLDMVKKQVDLSSDSTGQLRLVELSSCKIHSVHAPMTQLELLSSISGNKIFRVEEIPQDQLRSESDELLIPVAHFHKEIHQCFGIPFYLKVKANEHFHEVKERIRKILDVPEKDFEKYKFCICHLGKQTYLEDDNYRISAKDLNPQSVWCGTVGITTWLGIDHVNKTPKRPRPNYLEKAVRIYN